MINLDQKMISSKKNCKKSSKFSFYGIFLLFFIDFKIYFSNFYLLLDNKFIFLAYKFYK
jgi:hypothetical protein